MEVITDTDFMVEKGIYKDFNIKNVGEYYDFYVWSNRLLLGNAIENCQIMYLDIYELHLSSFLTGLWLEWQAALKKTKVILGLLTDVNMLLMVEKGSTGGTYHAINRYAKTNKRYIKDFDKSKEVSYFKYQDVNILYEWAMSQKVFVNKDWLKWLKCVEDISEFD